LRPRDIAIGVSVTLGNVWHRPGPNAHREGLLKGRPGRERYVSGAADFLPGSHSRARSGPGAAAWVALRPTMFGATPRA